MIDYTSILSQILDTLINTNQYLQAFVILAGVVIALLGILIFAEGWRSR